MYAWLCTLGLILLVGAKACQTCKRAGELLFCSGLSDVGMAAGLDEMRMVLSLLFSSLLFCTLKLLGHSTRPGPLLSSKTMCLKRNYLYIDLLPADFAVECSLWNSWFGIWGMTPCLMFAFQTGVPVSGPDRSARCSAMRSSPSSL